MKPSDNTAITHHDGGTTLTGDAITLMRWKSVQMAIRLWAQTGMKMTRGANISYLLAEATKITGKPYKKSAAGYAAAVDDLEKSITTLRSAIPDIDKRTDRGNGNA
jgi:hypothetical protein